MTDKTPNLQLIEAVDTWFKNNTGLGGCSDLDVTTLAAIFSTAPIDMVLHCPACGLQHIDTSEDADPLRSWDNPPHRSHLCLGCGHIWRPADVPTNGVKAVTTKGKADSPIRQTALRPTDTDLNTMAAAAGLLLGLGYRDSSETILRVLESFRIPTPATPGDSHE